MRKIQPERPSDQAVADHFVFRSGRQQIEGATDTFQHRQNAAALLWGILGHDGFKWRPGHPPVDLRVGPGDPITEVFGARVVLQQMRKDLARALDEEAILPVALGEERLRDSFSFGVVEDLIGRGPVRHASVERIQENVLAPGIEELGQILACRVIDNGSLSPLADLDKSWRISDDLPVPVSPMTRKCSHSFALAMRTFCRSSL